MPVKIFEDNYIVKSGLKLPRVYIEKITARDTSDEGHTYVELEFELACFVQKSFDILEDEFDNYIKNLINDTNFCIMFLPKTTMRAADTTAGRLQNLEEYGFLDATRELNLLPRLRNGNLLAYDLLVFNDLFCSSLPDKTSMYYSTTADEAGTCPKVYSYFIDQNGVEATTLPTMKDAAVGPERNSTLIFQLNKSEIIGGMSSDNVSIVTNNSGIEFVKIKFSDTLLFDNDDDSGVESGGSGIYGFSTTLSSGFSFEILAFSSMLSSTELDRKSTSGLKENRLSVSRSIMNEKFSDITYESIGVNGQLTSAPQIVYRNSIDNSVYNASTPVQALDNLYYSSIDISLSNIIESFRGLIGITTDEQLQSAYDNVNYILSVYGEAPGLLIRLNEYRKIYPDKTNLTPAGNFYQTFEQLIYNTNTAIQNTGIKLVRSININPTVLDLRIVNAPPLSNIVSRDRIGHSTAVEGASNIVRFVTDEDDHFINVRNAHYGNYTDPIELGNSLTSRASTFEEYITSVVRYDDQFALSGEIAEELVNYADGAEDLILQKIDAAFNEAKKFVYPPGGSCNNTDYKIFFDRVFSTLLHVGSDILFTVEHDNTVAGTTHRYNFSLTECLTVGPGIPGGEKQVDSDGNLVKASGTPGWGSWGRGRHGGIYVTLFGNGSSNGEGSVNLLRFELNSEDGVTKQGEYGVYDNGAMGTSGTGFNNFLEALHEYIHYSTIYDGWNITRVDKFNHFLFGYWWFDYEKALKEHSFLSFCFPIWKIEQYFGHHFTNENFKLNTTSVKRFSCRKGTLSSANMEAFENKTYNWNDAYIDYKGGSSSSKRKDSAIMEGDLLSYHINSSTNQAFTTDSTEIQRDQYKEYIEGHGPVYRKRVEGTISCDTSKLSRGAMGGVGVDVVASDEREHTYNILRCPHFANEELNDYRLMCFEHQEVSGHIGANTEVYFPLESAFDGNYHNSFYTYSVLISDKTYLTAKAIKEQYWNYIDDLRDYIDRAQEQCNFDSVDGSFNDFYIDYQTKLYAEDPGVAPWYKGPVIYHLHLDLITDIYNGDLDRIFIEARKDSLKISPAGGTYAHIEAFFEKYKALYDQYYSETGALVSSINTQIGSDSFATWGTFESVLGDGDLYFLPYTNPFWDIGEPVNMIVTKPDIYVYDAPEYVGVIESELDGSAGTFSLRGGLDTMDRTDELVEWLEDEGAEKVICKELYRQGLLDTSIFIADEQYGLLMRKTDPAIVDGYKIWAAPVVKLMKKSTLVTQIVYAIAKPWTKEMAYQMGVLEKGSIIGKMLMFVGNPFCKMVNYMFSKKQFLLSKK